jgi:hypothetical protein
VEAVPALSISPIEDDHVSFRRIFSRSGMERNSAIHAMFGLESALPLLRQKRIPIILW